MLWNNRAAVDGIAVYNHVTLGAAARMRWKVKRLSLRF